MIKVCSLRRLHPIEDVLAFCTLSTAESFDSFWIDQDISTIEYLPNEGIGLKQGGPHIDIGPLLHGF